MNTGSLRLPVAAAFATITAAICLGPIFLSGAWFFPTAFGVLVAVRLLHWGRALDWRG